MVYLCIELEPNDNNSNLDPFSQFLSLAEQYYCSIKPYDELIEVKSYTISLCDSYKKSLYIKRFAL